MTEEADRFAAAVDGGVGEPEDAETGRLVELADRLRAAAADLPPGPDQAFRDALRDRLTAEAGARGADETVP